MLQHTALSDCEAFGLQARELALDLLVPASLAWVISVAPKLHRRTQFDVRMLSTSSFNKYSLNRKHEIVFHLLLLLGFVDSFAENNSDSDPSSCH